MNFQPYHRFIILMWIINSNRNRFPPLWHYIQLLHEIIVFFISKCFNTTNEQHSIIPSGFSIPLMFETWSKGRAFLPGNLIHDDYEWVFIVANRSIGEISEGCYSTEIKLFKVSLYTVIIGVLHSNMRKLVAIPKASHNGYNYQCNLHKWCIQDRLNHHIRGNIVTDIATTSSIEDIRFMDIITTNVLTIPNIGELPWFHHILWVRRGSEIFHIRPRCK